MVRFFEEYDTKRQHSYGRLYISLYPALIYKGEVQSHFIHNQCRELTEAEARTTYPSLFVEVDMLQSLLNEGGMWSLLSYLKGKKA